MILLVEKRRTFFSSVFTITFHLLIFHDVFFEQSAKYIKKEIKITIFFLNS